MSQLAPPRLHDDLQHRAFTGQISQPDNSKEPWAR